MCVCVCVCVCEYVFGLIRKVLLWQIFNTSFGIFNDTVRCRIISCTK